jgi:outer membrane lipoprotein SlyB
MAEKKRKEDNRDIFEKALDNAPLIGAVLGGSLAGRKMYKIGRSEGSGRTSSAAQAGLAGMYGATAGGFAGAAIKNDINKSKRRK